MPNIKEYNDLRIKYKLHTGLIDDVMKRLRPEIQILLTDEGTDYKLECPFCEEHECEYVLEETVYKGEEADDDLEMMLLATASHMVTNHSEWVPIPI